MSEETLPTISRNSNSSKRLLNTCCRPGTPPHNSLECYDHSPPPDEEVGVQRHSQHPRTGKWQVRSEPDVVLLGATLFPGALAMTDPWISDLPVGGMPFPLTPGCWQTDSLDGLVWEMETQARLPRSSWGWLQMNSRVLYLQDAEARPSRTLAMILHVLQRKEPFPESFYDWTPHFACLVSQKSKRKLIQPPEFDGAAPSSRGIGGNWLYSGSHSRCAWLECETRVEFGEGQGTRVKSYRALLFSLEMAGFCPTGNGESPCGFWLDKQRGHIFMCDILLDLEIRDHFLEEVSVNLGLKGWVGCQAAEVFMQGRSSCDNKVCSGFTMIWIETNHFHVLSICCVHWHMYIY